MPVNIKLPINLALSICILFSSSSCSLLQSSTSTFSPEESSSLSPLISGKKVAVAQNIKTTTIVAGLERPWGMTWLPDETILITERPGKLRVVKNGVLVKQAISGIPQVLAEGQGGLLDISAHPNFSRNKLIYLTYAHGNKSANRTRVARATFNGSTLENLEVIFEVSQTKEGTQHFGSRIVWLSDQTMLVAFGDGGNPPLKLNGDLIRKQAQNLNSYLGKVVRLNDDGSVPTDNPFVTTENADAAIWSYGHRNIQGLAVDRANNRLWSTEHGARGGDELNWVKASENYGWPEVSHSNEYFGGRVAKVNSRLDVVAPKLVWTPSIAPSGLAFYSGNSIPQWQGDLFAGGLVSKDVRRIDLDELGNILAEESIPIGARVRDVRQSPDGGLYVLTDETNGRLIRIEPG